MCAKLSWILSFQVHIKLFYHIIYQLTSTRPTSANMASSFDNFNQLSQHVKSHHNSTSIYIDFCFFPDGG